MDAKTLETLILDALPGASVRVEDLRGDGAIWSAWISAPDFAGKSRLDQHRMVYAALKDRIGDSIHSLSLQTTVPQ